MTETIPHPSQPGKQFRRRWRLLVLSAVASVLAALAAALALGELLSRPARLKVGDAPRDLMAQSVQIPIDRPETAYVRGWFARSHQREGGVLLLHGVRSSRLQMIDRVRFLKAAGYSVLLIDLPAHGESHGERITFGAREGDGVLAALDYLRQELPNEPIGVIGVSLGAASLVLSRPKPPPEAVILESMYPTITDAVADRIAIRLGSAGRSLAPLLMWQLPLRIGVTANDLRPIDAIASLGAPVLIVAGTEDKHTTLKETERIYAAAREPKQLWAVQGAAHVDLHRFDADQYETRVIEFLHAHLRR
jgi:uncharacterized protein